MTAAVLVTVPARVTVIAVTIGIVELCLGEAFKAAWEFYFAWRRRSCLYKTGRLRISNRALVNRRHSLVSFLLISGLFILTIILELSIDPVTLKGARVAPAGSYRCYAPRGAMGNNQSNETRYHSKTGPRSSDLNAKLIAPYIEQAGCTAAKSILSDALQGISALTNGYPDCLKPWDPKTRVKFELQLKGCGVGPVGDSPAGEYHCDMALKDDDSQSELSGSSFFTIHMYSLGGTVASYFKDRGEVEKVLFSNTGIPIPWQNDANPDSANTVNITCDKNNVQCYESVRDRVRSARKQKLLYTENRLALFIASLPGKASSLCTFENAVAEVQWVAVNHSIKGVDRGGRHGPTVTSIVLEGDARCVPDIPQHSARLYLDSVEYLSLREVLPPSDASRRGLAGLLQHAAVIAGKRTAKGTGKSCRPFAAVAGATLGVPQLATTAVYSGILFATMLFSLCAGLIYRLKCPITVDPLNPLWPVRQLIRLQRDLSAQHQASGGISSATSAISLEGKDRRKSLAAHPVVDSQYPRVSAESSQSPGVSSQSLPVSSHTSDSLRRQRSPNTPQRHIFPNNLSRQLSPHSLNSQVADEDLWVGAIQEGGIARLKSGKNLDG